MESDRECNEKESCFKEGDVGVKELQQALFPVGSTTKGISPPGGFFMNLVLKTTHLDDDDNQEQYLLKKESKELFAIIRDASATIQPARWPTECQVLDEKVKHIYYTPSTAEPYYTPTGKEVQPKPVGEELGIIVYQYYPISAVNYFSRSSIGGSRYLLPTCPTPDEDSLRFESRFESGNLAKAIKITAIYYELYLRTDLYTNKHMQWFYFRVTNMKKNVMYRFSIVNMTKDESLFNEGMKPLLYSTKDAQLHCIGWRRCGDNITYYCNDNAGTDDPDQVMTYTLTFTLEFPHDGDTVYLAYSYPYTYSDLQDYLLELSKHPVKSTYTTLRLLCRTLAGNNLYYVTVTAPQEITASEPKKKKAVIVTARVHPGEAPSSWMMKGVLDFLTGDSGPAKELREKFIFKIVPMLNPDGVIVGNNRCSLTGRDLNRQYRTVIRETYPSIWYTKLMIRRMLEECGVAMYCDLHAHSRKHNIFIYGCETRRCLEKRLGEQVFPLMLHKNAADKFSFESCKFRIQRCKEGTGRVVMWMMGIANSYTMEASFAGTLLGARAETHFTPQDYEQMGRAFCQTLLDFYDDDPRKERLRNKIIERLAKEGSNADEPTNIPLSDYSSDDGDTSSSSDEVGRDEFIAPLIVPPPSPAITKRHNSKPKTAQSKVRSYAKQQNIGNEPRRPLPMYKTNIDLFLPRPKEKYTSYTSSSSSDSELSTYKKKAVQKRRVKKRTRKQRQKLYYKHSDTDLQESKTPPRCLSVLDLLPTGKFRSHSWHRTTTALPPKPLYDVRPTRTTTQQLAEVQSKLISLKNRLWLGTGGEGDSSIPLSWGPSKFSEYNLNNSRKTTNKKQLPQTESKPDRSDKRPYNKKTKSKEEKAGKKKQNGLRRQMAIEWIPTSDLNKIRKTKSLPANLTKKDSKNKLEKQYENEIQGCDDDNAKSKTKKKNKKKKSKLQKNVTAVSNANVFIRKEKD